MKKLSIIIVVFAMFMLSSVFVTVHAGNKPLPKADAETMKNIQAIIKYSYDNKIVGKHSFLAVYVYPRQWNSINMDDKSIIAMGFALNRKFRHDGIAQVIIYSFLDGKQIKSYWWENKK